MKFDKLVFVIKQSRREVFIMAKGCKCPQCGTSMYALKEVYEEKGTYVTYQCTNNECKFELKQFEDN